MVQVQCLSTTTTNTTTHKKKTQPATITIQRLLLLLCFSEYYCGQGPFHFIVFIVIINKTLELQHLLICRHNENIRSLNPLMHSNPSILSHSKGLITLGASSMILGRLYRLEYVPVRKITAVEHETSAIKRNRGTHRHADNAESFYVHTT